jgi:hypothetical protein
MKTFRDAVRCAAAIAVAGSAMVLLSMSISRCANAQVTPRPARGGFAPLLASASAPSALSVTIRVDADSTPLTTVLHDITRRAKVGIVYDRSLPGLGDIVSLHVTDVTAAAALLRVLDGKPLDVLVAPTGQLVLVRHVVRPGQVRGIVVDSAGAPVTNAFIELDSTRLVAVSATDGSFAFARVAPGEYTMRTRRLGFRPAMSTIHVADGDLSVAPQVVTLEPTPVPLTAVVVSPGYFGIMAQQIGAPQTLDRDEIRTRPQLGDDLFRSINRLPGLSSNDFSAGFHVRGSDIDQMYVTFDGVQLVEPFHLKDIESALSILDVGTVDGVDLTTGGFTSEYGGRLGSLLSIRSVEPDPSVTRTTVGLSITNLRLQSEGGFAGGRGSWVVAARRGYLDFALKLAGASDSLSPVYADVFAKTSWMVNDRNRISLHVLDAEDGLHYTDTDGQIRSSYSSRYAWLTWDSRIGEQLSGQSVVSASGLTWSRTGVPSFRRNEDMHDNRTFRDVAVRENWNVDLAQYAAIKFGGEAHALGASYDYNGIHTTTRYVGGVIQQVRNVTSANLSPTGTSLGAFVAPRVSIGPRLTTEAGVRVDQTTYTSDALVSPRANLTASLTSSTSMRASVGRYDQPQPIYALQVGDGVTTFGSADISDQRAVSIDQRIGRALTVRVEAYDRDLVRERPRYINLRQTTDVFPEFPPDRMLLPATSGRSHGVELMARRQVADGLAWTASYALASVVDNVGGIDVPRTYDQRHTVYVDAAYHPANASWRFSAAWQVHSGWPQPPVSFVADTIRVGPPLSFSVTPVYGPLSALGAQRLAWYRRLDLRYTRDIETSRGRVSFFADLFNVLDAKNPRYDDYNVSLQNGKVVVQPSPSRQVGRFPSAGVSWKF